VAAASASSLMKGNEKYKVKKEKNQETQTDQRRRRVLMEWREGPCSVLLFRVSRRGLTSVTIPDIRKSKEGSGHEDESEDGTSDHTPNLLLWLCIKSFVLQEEDQARTKEDKPEESVKDRLSNRRLRKSRRRSGGSRRSCRGSRRRGRRRGRGRDRGNTSYRDSKRGIVNCSVTINEVVK
jgi:hypothetical protein